MIHPSYCYFWRDLLQEERRAAESKSGEGICITWELNTYERSYVGLGRSSVWILWRWTILRVQRTEWAEITWSWFNWRGPPNPSLCLQGGGCRYFNYLRTNWIIWTAEELGYIIYDSNDQGLWVLWAPSSNNASYAFMWYLISFKTANGLKSISNSDNLLVYIFWKSILILLVCVAHFIMMVGWT